MTDRNWEAELARIDKQLSSLSDEELRRAAPAPAAAAPPPRTAPAPRGAPLAGAPWHGWVRTGAAVAAGAGLWFWPWPGTCGAPLAGFTAAAGGVVLVGAWSAVGTWRHRQGALHLLSLLAMLWGGILAAREVLPRVGYAIPTAAHPAQWRCAVPAPAAPAGAPAGVPASPPSGAAAALPLAPVRALPFAA